MLNWKRLLAASILSLGVFASNSALAASPEKTLRIEINGVEVHSSANRLSEGTSYADVAAYTKLIGQTYEWDAAGKTVKVNGKTVEAKIAHGVPTAPVRLLAEATGAEKVTWDQASLTAYVLDLPEGTIQLTPAVPMMGEHWANPKDMPLGPIYGVMEGKLVFIEEMPALSVLNAGKSILEVAGMKGLPSPPIDHTDFDFQPKGHEGFEVPHFDIHHYFVPHGVHMQFALPPNGAAADGHAMEHK